jgi:hypothetical protein
MLEESTNSASNSEIEYIQIAADLLRRMLLELKGLEANYPRVRFAMSNSGHAIQRRLDVLSEIIGWLKAAQDPSHARELGERARELIRQLAGELEQPALEAERHFDWIT